MLTTQARTELLLSALGMHMRERRRSLGITQEKLAEKTGLSLNYVGKLEASLKVPSFNVLVRLAGALGIEVHELLAYGESPMTEAALEIVRVMEQFDEQDAAFMLGEFRHIAAYLKSFRGNEG